ncbi:AAA family ATPase [Sorangium sp. So ce1151]|uniref:AAA family ATPase n=1 Tax=Sorangium sp. So ce1151 TaxID=3133332 RepID=UPI003F5F37BB
MSIQVPIGIDDFRRLRELGLEYVDKSHLIQELVDRPGTEVVLLPRPRRFGKTLNLSMLRCFFERHAQDLSPLFRDLRIWQAGEQYRTHFQRYPVLHLTFKGVKAESFDAFWEGVQDRIARLFDEHRDLLGSGALSEREARRYREVLDGTAGRIAYETALLDLSSYLHRFHGERVVILLDEYDEPLHAGYLHGYAAQVIGFFRAFLTEGLKGNPHLFKAVLTGVLRVARESIFSGLNNVAVYSLLAPEFDTCFGFTEPEVESLLTRFDRLERLPSLRAWYNGYLFGGTVVYNPWSVLNFLSREDGAPQPYWVNTSSNDLVREQLERRALALEPAFAALLDGGSIERVLDESVPLGELDRSDEVLWSLLVFTGYLRAEKRSRGSMEQPSHLLSIPNREVRGVYTTTFRRWLGARLERQSGGLDRLLAALLAGDAERFEAQLQAFATDVLSYHDTGRPDPEQVMQGFVLGLLAALEPDHQVRSNRESGRGRPDVIIRPSQPGRPGVVLELKVARGGRTLEHALEEGIEQIRRNDYTAELRAAGASPIHALAVAFDGKLVRAARVPEAAVP